MKPFSGNPSAINPVSRGQAWPHSRCTLIGIRISVQLPGGATWVTREDVDALVDYFCRVGKRSVVHFRIRLAVPDPDNDMVLEAAIASGSDWIVTHNVRDLATAAARFGIDVVTPAEALRRLGETR